MPNDQDPIPYQTPIRRSVSGLAIASMIMGILAIPLDIAFFAGSILGILAIVFGIIAVIHINRTQRYSGKPLAIAGIILGIVSLILAIGCGIMIFGGSFH